MASSAHAEESFEDFSQRYVSFFQNAEDLFEVQRGLNNCFAHDLVPSPEVVDAALRAARRVNDYATAVRIFDGVREKVENKEQYAKYLEELKPVTEELGMFFCYVVVLGRVLIRFGGYQVLTLWRSCMRRLPKLGDSIWSRVFLRCVSCMSLFLLVGVGRRR